MDMRKIQIVDAEKEVLGVVCANVSAGVIVIDGKPFDIKKVNKASHKYEVCFVKGKNSRLYP